jgi:hypothetical protein
VIDISTLVKRARLQRVTNRAHDLDQLREMLDGAFRPRNGFITPPFQPGSARHAAYERALRTTATIVPVVITKGLAGLDFNAVTWSDAEKSTDRADDELGLLNLPSIARRLAVEYELTGVCAAMASTPRTDTGFGEPVTSVLTGVNIPYTDQLDPGRVTGWYRAVQYVTDAGQLAWWVEVYDFLDDNRTMHRVWERLQDPTSLGGAPNQEFESPARPRFALYDVQPDGLPASPLLANTGRVLGLYASELRLATSEELSAFPMLVTSGFAEMEQVGPAEVITTGADGKAAWLEPGKLDELREQVRLKRDQVREALQLPGGSLGGQTPSGEALQEANRGFLQKSTSLAGAISGVLTDLASDFLALHDLPPVTVSVPIDRNYTTGALLDVVEKGVDLGAVPVTVAARWFQQALGAAYSDDELTAFLDDAEARRNASTPGFLPRGEDA